MIQNMHEDSPLGFETIGELTIKPRQETQFFVGLYEDVIPQPILRIIYDPNNNQQVLASLIRIDNIGDYSLAYQFTNISDQNFTIIVQAKWSDLQEAPGH